MQFALDSDQILLKESVDKWLHERYGARQARAYRSAPEGYSRENWNAMATLGLLALPFAADDGGLNGGAKELITVMESMGRSMAVEPFLEEVVLAAGLLARAGSAQQRATWLPRVTGGTAHVALAHFEHAARFNDQHVSVRATVHAGEVCLDGEKSMVPLASSADLWLVSAQGSKSATDPGGIGVYLVSPDADGIERRDFRLMDGTVASFISFRHAPTSGCLPGAAEAFDLVLDVARLAAGAQMVGIMSSIYASTLDYLRSRRQFGAAIASFQAVQHRMADLYVSLEQCRSLVYRAALTLDTPGRRALGVAGMKSYVSGAAIALGEDCVHFHGAMGMTDELDVGVGFKRLSVLAAFLGDCDNQLSRYMRLSGETDGAQRAACAGG